MKYAIYFVGLVLAFVGAFVMHGWISWIVLIIGVILTYVPNAMSENEAMGETDKTTLWMLMLAANADGKMTDSENKYIQEYVRRRGLSEKQVNTVLKHIQDPSYFKISYDDGHRERLIDELIGVVKADGKVTDEEKKIVEIAAEAINYPKEKALARLNK